MTPTKANANETESGKSTKTKGKWKTNDCKLNVRVSERKSLYYCIPKTKFSKL